MFNEEKSAHVAAYLLRKRGGKMSYMKLIKLMYLADRDAMDRYGDPITDDHWVSMRHGPVLSNVLELVQGGSRSGEWEKWVIPSRVAYEAELAKEISIDDLDELSRADIASLDRVWEEFGSMDRWQLVDLVHETCAEWKDPNGSAFPISPQDVFKALGRSSSQSEVEATKIFQRRRVEEIFSEIR
ncbi:Panacea domain-containing protein [Cobetia sp. 29-18-1]|uniref:Panacea domain-containing protein n=1 Tax=Cobetia sp. 29-18-1 TaxID=3040018 RepID=UPI00244D4BB7|nr:Panacea domain-containing protein [Cobetia sp. 29-18-1]MDH2299656.1 Panacea domain-containing protein [Cobetia sp. 29-18-1]